MTNTALKSQIDTDITNKIGAGSISKTNVGTNLKAVVDYVDQQVPKTMHVLISQEGVTAPTITYLKNDTGLTLSLSRSNSGRYTATLSSPITQNKTSLLMGNGNGTYIINAQFNGNTNIQIVNFTNESGVNVYYDDVMFNIAMKIEIYP